MARRLDDVDDVALQLGRDVDATERVRPRGDVVRVGDRLELFGRDRARVLRVEDRELGVAVGIADAQAQEEAVELRLGQRDTCLRARPGSASRSRGTATAAGTSARRP